MCSKLFHFAPWGLLLAAALLALPAFADDGLLGIYFDRDARNCSGDIPAASFSTLYVVLLPEGSTYGGIFGAEFRIDTSSASGFLFQGERAESGGATMVGMATGSGATMGLGSCHSGRVVPILSFQVFNSGSASGDAALRVTAKTTPSNPNFPCAVAVLCDSPTFTEICVDGGVARLNPSSPRPCGSARLDSEWSRVKGLFR